MRGAYPYTKGQIVRDGVGLHYEIYGEGERTILIVLTWAIIHLGCSSSIAKNRCSCCTPSL